MKSTLSNVTYLHLVCTIILLPNMVAMETVLIRTLIFYRRAQLIVLILAVDFSVY